MEKEWIPVVSALVSGLLVGLVAVGLKLVDVLAQRDQDSRQFWQEKLETLHLSLDSFMASCVRLASGLDAARFRELPTPDLIAYYHDEMRDLVRQLGIIRSSVQLYIPEARPELEVFKAALDQFLGDVVKPKESETAGEASKQLISPLERASLKLAAKIEEKVENRGRSRKGLFR